MTAKILDDGPELPIVEVYDRRANRHLIEVDLTDDGAIGRHGQDAYPRDPDARTDEQERMMLETEQRARYELHVETDHDLVDPGWDPRILERGLQAVEAMELSAFESAFEDFYRALSDPERTKAEYGIETGSVEFEGEPRVALVQKGVCVDGDRVASVVDGVHVYYNREGMEQAYGTGVSPDCAEGTTFLSAMLPPIEREDDDFVYPEDFRDLVLNNFACQIRDVYRNMAEDPPARFDVEGFGKPNIVRDVEF